MESLIQQQLPGGVHLRGETRGLGCEDIDPCWVVLIAVPASDVVLSYANRVRVPKEEELCSFVISSC